MITFHLIAGIVASSIHVFSGPDHLAAVTPIVIETEKKAWKIGLSWGFGHISGMLLIGILFLFFNDLIPIDAISSYSEQFVGIVLIFIGLWSFYLIRKDNRKHVHIHSEEQPYVHSHKVDKAKNHSHSKTINQNIFSSFGIGIIHGLAGVAHFVLLLPIMSFETLDGINYVIGFAIGTLLAMTLYTLILGSITAYTKQKNKPQLYKGIRICSGILAILVGIYWLFFN
ncbi:MAG: sulfite exporter TauE/SafE family protein [Flavobacteriaceae bacterium]|nr:sulfite exporter TauE/SafE family protein [Flavobacteriaceae bacterium]